MKQPNDKLEAIFEAALALATDEQRAAYLERACPDAEVRREVESLLEAHRHPDSVFADEATDSPGAERMDRLQEPPGTVIGRYKLLQRIGEGGMGVVYMAEQEEPVRRRVALKIIKLGMDTKQVVARFEAERQALALMDHPNIARVLDGGATETGRPYFVMELVQGVPITEFCDKNRLSAEQRLRLFVPVCQAIQSAHQKGIIHRDLKPTNILVTLNPDGSGFPKVIDFGVAKATSQKLTEKTLFTAHGMMVGTPAYMSPEQAEMSHLDVDTRADIYSLGALLYELLTGTPPFPEQRLRSAGYNEMQRIILEEQPVKPSTRLSTLQGEQRSIVARNRSASEATLGRGFPSDLDWIVMKCLEKDRARRYETANGLAHDIERHLRDEPVTARPPSWLYEFQKTLRRHWVGFAAVGAVVVALAMGVVVSTFEAVRAQRAQANEAKQKSAAQQILYRSLVGEARATRLARRVGYRDRVFALLSQAKSLDVPERNLADLRNEAVACLGDFVGLTPATFTNSTTNFLGACLGPSGNLAACGFADSTIEVREMPSGRERARLSYTNGFLWALRFNSAGDELFAVVGPWEWETNFARSRRVCAWAPAADGRWRETGNRAVPGATGRLLCSEAGVFDIALELGWEGQGQVIAKINPGSPAEKSHLQVGDRVVGFGGSPLGPEDYLPDRVQKHGGQATPIIVERGGQRVELTITPELDPASKRSRLGMSTYWRGRNKENWNQAVFRLVNVKSGAFVPGYVVTNTPQPGDKIGARASGNGAVLAVETGPGAAPNFSSVVNLYDWKTGARLNQLHRSSLETISLSEDGKYFSPEGADIYSLPSLERVVQFEGTGATAPWDPVAPIVFSRNVAAVPVPRQNHIRLWNLVSREDVGRLDEPEGSFVLPIFALDGSSLLTVRDRRARWYRLSTPEKLSLPGHSAGVGAVAFSPDGKRLASVADRVVRVCDVLTGHTIWETNDLPGSHSLSYSPDGRWLATGYWDTELVCIRDAHTGQRLLELGTNGVGRSWSVQFSPDGRYFATATEPYGLRIWTIDPSTTGAVTNGLGVKLLSSWVGDASSEPTTLKFPNGHTPISVAFAPDGRSVAFWCVSSGPGRVAGNDGTIYVWDFERSAQPHEVAYHILSTEECESFTPDGRSLLTVDTNGIVVAVDVVSGKQIQRPRARNAEPDSPGLRLSPDGSKLAVRAAFGRDLRIRDPETAKLLFSLPPESGGINGFAWSPDSRRLAVARDNGNIAIWDLEIVNQILTQLGLNP
jgi:serine/threonine protein kinase/WD40 repeat protein